jgi:hypothetical protein
MFAYINKLNSNKQEKLPFKRVVSLVFLSDPFPRTDVPFPRTDVPFPRTDVPFPRTDVLFPRTDVPFPRTDIPFPRTDIPFPRTGDSLGFICISETYDLFDYLMPLSWYTK